MFIQLDNIYIIFLNILGIPMAHMVLSWCTTKLPGHLFATKHPLDSAKLKKPIHPIYEHIFHIRLWKDKLPDAGPWFNGFAKGALQSTSKPYLLTYVAETRRGEFSHWLQVIIISCFIIWNPWPANLIIITYAILSNLPCILSQRFNRQRILKILSRAS